MPSASHIEHHFTSSEVVRDIVIGMSDGLTVPFALAAGLTGAVNASHIIVVAGLAEIAAGSIAMGLGGYLAARSDAEHYESERKREEWEVVERNADEVQEVHEVFRAYGLAPAEIEPVVRAFQNNHKAWVDWMMRFELGLEEPDPKRAVSSAATIAFSYIAGGLVTLPVWLIYLWLVVRDVRGEPRGTRSYGGGPTPGAPSGVGAPIRPTPSEFRRGAEAVPPGAAPASPDERR